MEVLNSPRRAPDAYRRFSWARRLLDGEWQVARPGVLPLKARILRSGAGLCLWLGLLGLLSWVNDWAGPIGISADWAPVSVWLTLAVLTGLLSRSWLLGLGCFFVPVAGAAFAFWGLVATPMLSARASREPTIAPRGADPVTQGA